MAVQCTESAWVASCPVPPRLPHFLPPPLGRKVVVVRCEGINISGNFYRNKRKLRYGRRVQGLTCEGLGQPFPQRLEVLV